MHLLKSKESIGMLFGIFAYLSFSILDAIQKIKSRNKPIKSFGNGGTAEKFFKIMNKDNVWKISRQKKFNDII